MALSPAMQWALNNGMTEADVYKNINDFLATNPTAAQSQAQMAQYGISGADVAAATGGTSGGMLGGNILAGASWNSLNTTLGDQLTAATGQATSNYAVGGATTADTLKQLDTFLAGGGQFDPKATVYLQTGGVDFLQGVDKGTIKDNITQIVQTLGNQGVNVVLTGSPYATSLNDVVTNNFDPKVDPLFTEIAKENSNVALVGTQGELLQNKALLVDALHTNAEGTAIYNQSVIDALSQFKNTVPASTPQAIAQVQQSNTVATTPSVITQAANVASNYSDPIKAAEAANNIITSNDINKAVQVDKTTQIDLQKPIEKAQSNQSMADIQAAITAESIARQKASEQTYWQKIAEKRAADEAAALAAANTSTTTQRVIPTTRGTVIEGDDIEAQIAGVPQVVYQTRVDPNNTANWETYNPTTGEVIDRGTFAGGGDKGLLAAAAPVIGLAAATVGLPGITGLLGGLTGTTGSTLAGLTGAAISGGTNAIAGGSASDIARAALLGGAGAYGGSVLNNYLDTGSFTDPGITEKQFAIQDAKQLAAQGLSTAQIQDTLTAGGYNDITVERALASITTPASTGLPTTTTTTGLPTTAATDTVNITGTGIPTLNTGGLLSSLVGTPAAAVSTPVTDGGTVKVTGTSTPQMTTQEAVNLVNSQLASNVTKPANLATINVTGTGTPATTQDLVTAITAALPTVTPVQATTLAEQLITSNKNITVNDAMTALSAVIPTLTSPAATTLSTVDPRVTITAPQTKTTTQDLINATTATLPAVSTPSTVDPRVTITADRPSSITDAVTAATIPLIQPSTPLTVPSVTAAKTNELGLTDEQMLKLLQGGLGLLGGLGGASLLGGGGTSTGIGSIPTQTMPVYNDDYFTKVQQNYNRILPAVPRDVASPLRDWYTSQYGA